MNKKLFSLFFTPIILALPFIFTSNFWWLTFITPLLLINASQTIASSRQWFIFFLLYCTLCLHGAAYALWLMAHGNWLQRIALPTAIILYQALWPTSLFSFAIHINKKITNLFYRDLTILITIVIYWFVVHNFALYPIGGNLFMHPLVLLTQQPSLLWPLKFISPHIACVVFLLPTLIFKSFVHNKKILCFVSSFIFISYLLIACYQPVYTKVTTRQAQTLQPAYPSSPNITTRPPVYAEASTRPGTENATIITLALSLCTHNAQSCANILINKVNDIKNNFPQTQLIVLPESAINCDDQRWIELVAQRTTIPLIIGTFTTNQQRYNSAIFISNQTSECYHKQQLLPFVESDSWLAGLFHHKNAPLAQHANKRPTFIINKQLSVIPYICSELFFTNKKPKNKTPIIALCNDTWFSATPYMQKLMENIAFYRSFLWQNDIIYISYAQSWHYEYKQKVKLIMLYVFQSRFSRGK